MKNKEPVADKKEAKEEVKETPNQKFKRVAGIRVSNALKAIKLIGNLNGPQYVSSEDDICCLVTALKKEIEETETNLLAGIRQSRTFSFD